MGPCKPLLQYTTHISRTESQKKTKAKQEKSTKEKLEQLKSKIPTIKKTPEKNYGCCSIQ